MADIEAQPQTSSQDPSAIFKTTNRPVTLKFEDVVYKIKEKKGGLILGMSKKPVDKLILKGLTGVVYPGEMLAMLGPSGSGKTTLLTALGGRLGGCLGGRITYNAKPFTNQMKRNTGFVTQDDVVYEHLTVSETLAYTALLRLPNTLTTAQKIAQADAVIGELGLTKCRNSVVGGPMLRGISGGERKRVSIGQEMLINPSLLFLDEPTSGLDSTTAQRIVSTLWGLANGGRTVVMTIHQPSSRLFYMFHKVMVLSEGHSLYFGFGSEVMNYFSSIGYAPSIAMNPSDFLLDLANGISSDDGQEDQNVTKQALVSSYKSELLDKVLAEVCKNDGQVQEQVGDKDFGRWTTTWWQQFSVLIKRGVKERRHESFSWLHIIQVAVVSLLCGLLWWQSNIAHLQDQIGLLFFYSGFWAFYPLFQAIFTFPRERMMLAKERSSGMYRLSSFFMAYTMADLPMELVLPTAFTIVTYWMAGLKPTALNFFLTLFVVLYNVLVSQGLGLAIGALVMNQKSASTLASVIMLSFLLASGYYVQHVPAFISWIKYVSISHHIYKLLLGSQYKPGDTYPCGLQVCYVSDFPIVNLIGLEGQLASVAAVFVMVVGYRLVAYVALMRIGVPK